MPGLLHVAAAHPTAASGWSMSGAMLTFAMPMVLFILAATALYLLLLRPHRVPGHTELLVARAAPPSPPQASTDEAPAGPEGAP
jgi:hypothetical protein